MYTAQGLQQSNDEQEYYKFRKIGDIMNQLNHLKYLVQDDTLKPQETLDLLEFRNKLISKLKEFK